MTQQLVKKGQQISLKIKRLGINGEGIGYYKKLIIFVPGALPKEEVTATITNVTPKFAEGTLQSVKKAAKDRVVPPCPVYETCGGCQLQHLAYKAQLDFKKDLLKQALNKFKPVNYQNYELRKTIGMENPWNYRNKAQFQLRQIDGQVEAGLYQADSHQLVPIDNCLVQQPATTKVMNTLVDLLNDFQLPIYDERKNSGIFRTLMVRVGIQTGEVQVVFITQSKKFPQKEKMVRAINEQLPEVVSIMQNVQNKKTSLVMGDDTLHLWGKESIEEHINDVVFDLSPRAFFQLNPEQTEVLYNEGIKALDYAVGTAEDLLPKWFKEGFKPDAIVVDPPRTGLDRKLLTALLKQPPKKMVYISCNVSTLARDLVQLAKVYQVDYLQSVDMFPQTARCEVVVKLTRK